MTNQKPAYPIVHISAFLRDDHTAYMLLYRSDDATVRTIKRYDMSEILFWSIIARAQQSGCNGSVTQYNKTCFHASIWPQSRENIFTVWQE